MIVEVVTITVNVRCRTCGNEDEYDIHTDPTEVAMVVPGVKLHAKSYVRECLLCRPALHGVR